MTAESSWVNFEQDPERVSTVREELRCIYTLSEVSQAVVEHYMGRADEYSLERFREFGEVTIKKGFFAFHFYPKIRQDRDAQFPSLVMARTPLLVNLREIEDVRLKRYTTGINPNTYTLAGRVRINASNPSEIEVTKHGDWLSDNELKFIHGELALDITENIIDSYLNPQNQQPQVPQV